jgi:hypothetical protein
MVELEDRDRAIEIERDVLELHGFLVSCACVSFADRNLLCRGAYLIFGAVLSMVITA